MNSLNKVMLIGNLTRDPEIRQTPKGVSVTDLGIAINRVYTSDSGERQEDVTFVDVTLWDRLAENAAQYLSKGRAVFIEGRLKLDSWEDKDSGQNRSRLRVVAERVQFLGGGAREDGTPYGITFGGRLYDEARLLTLAGAWQRSTEHHQRHPMR